MSEGKPAQPAPRYYRKRVELIRLIEKIKLWPSRTGQLHGLKEIAVHGDRATLTTHCNKTFTVSNSRNSRAARWLRNKWYTQPCPECGVPEWKLGKYSATRFKRGHGSFLLEDPRPGEPKPPPPAAGPPPAGRSLP